MTPASRELEHENEEEELNSESGEAPVDEKAEVVATDEIKIKEKKEN